MLQTLFDPETQNRMINGLLLMLIGSFFWRWLIDYGLPMGALLGIGALVLVFGVFQVSWH
jgi:hypothetical protein